MRRVTQNRAERVELGLIVLVLGALGARGLLGPGLTGGARPDGSPLGSAVGVTPTATLVVTQPPSPEPERPVAQEPFLGTPAIRPSRTPTDLLTPAYTEQDVRAYLERTSPGSVLLQMECLPAREVEARFDLGPGEFGDGLLCVVTVQGELSEGIPTDPPTVVVFHRAYLIFDGRTGNELGLIA